MQLKNISKETLIQSLERRLKHVMVQALDQCDKRFPESELVGRYKFDIKNMFNDAIRATRSELLDYDIEYRPLRFNPDNSISITKTLIESIERIEFTDTPGMKIIVSIDKLKVLESIRYEFGAGIMYMSDDDKVVIFEITGIDNCVNLAIPFMDKYKLVSSVSDKYLVWRKTLVRRYQNRS